MKFFKKSLFFTIAACFGLVVTSCKEDVTISINTYSLYGVTNTSASVNGTVSLVGDNIKESGFLLTTNSVITLTLANSVNHVGSSTLTDVRVTFTGLSADSSYRYRLYVLTDDSVYYGTTYSFYPGSVVVPTEVVQGGTFQMGGTAEQTSYTKANEFPVHTVTVDAFKIGTTEVTNAQFQKFLVSRKIPNGGTGLTADGSTRTLLYSNLHGLHYNTESSKWLIEPGFENHPVIRVTWYGASEFCRWAGGRLPTEAEWEWAARGGKTDQDATVSYIFSGGNLNDSTSVAWYKFNTKSMPDGHRDTQPVASKAKNSLNLYDMSGNAWEWVADWYNQYLPLSQTNPTGMSDADALDSGVADKVRRGGGWADEDVNALRVSRRDHNKPDLNLGSCGFRFAQDL